MCAATRSRYHVVAFPQIDEAAAFIAAFSRFLASPTGGMDERTEGRSEIWVRADQSDGGLAIYLSDGALAAAARGFGPPPLAGEATPETVHATCTLVLSGGDTPFGQDEVLRRLIDR
ncbi:MAG: hypothetical protein ACR2OG_08105 [Gemmatimonadaceae bacterium]